MTTRTSRLLGMHCQARSRGLERRLRIVEFCKVDVGGRFGKGLAAQGEAAMVAFATDWLADLLKRFCFFSASHHREEFTNDSAFCVAVRTDAKS